MSKPLSFNQWLACTTMSDPDGIHLANCWVSRRGRLTEASVERRAHDEYGLPAGFGAAMYRAYLAATAAV